MHLGDDTERAHPAELSPAVSPLRSPENINLTCPLRLTEASIKSGKSIDLIAPPNAIKHLLSFKDNPNSGVQLRWSLLSELRIRC